MRPSIFPTLLILLVLVAGCAEQATDPTPTSATAATPTASTTPPSTTPVVTTTPTPPTGSTVCDPTMPGVDGAFAPQKARVRFTTSAGSFIAEIETEAAPLTASNFLDLAGSGFYDGVLFHRVVKDFVIQGGDPLSKDANPGNDGTGDAGYEIPDEFHPKLRHASIGVLSMANSGPNTGSSQFFVTLDATPHLDDRHAVFGRVVQGLDVVQTIGGAPVDSNDRPVDDIRVEKVEILDPEAYEPARGAGIHVVIPEKKGEPGRATRFAVIAKNEGNLRDTFAVGAIPPQGWLCTLEAPAVVTPGNARVFFVALTPPAGTTGTATVPLYVTSSAGATANATVSLVMTTLGAPVKEGDKVTANYAGFLPDGRLFDTSMEGVAKAAGQPKFNTTGGYRDRGAWSTFPFTVGSGVIAGFTNLAKTAKVGETVTGYIPAADAYATGNMYERPLTGRDLIFELEIVKVG